jgi:hypothetical protein
VTAGLKGSAHPLNVTFSKTKRVYALVGLLAEDANADDLTVMLANDPGYLVEIDDAITKPNVQARAGAEHSHDVDKGLENVNHSKNSHQLPVRQYREAPDPMLSDEKRRLLEDFIGGHRDGVSEHDVPHGEVFDHGRNKHSTEIAIADPAHQTLLLVNYREMPDGVTLHELNGLLDRGLWGDGHRILGHASSYEHEDAASSAVVPLAREKY